MVPCKVLQAGCDACAAAKAGRDRVDFFLNGRRVAVHVRGHLGQAGVKDKHTGLGFEGKSTRHAQEQRGM